MKKVKLMLLSLVVFSVVGGALAFKAKLPPFVFCTTDAYTDGVRYYCTWNPQPGTITTTTCGPIPVPAVIDENPLVKKVCTTLSDEFGACPQACDILTSIMIGY